MLAILSPAKTLDFSPPPPGLKRTRPDLVDEAAVLVESALKPLGRAALKALLRVSDALASLNHERYQVWDRDHEGESETKQAALAFNGPAFKGLGADTLSEDELEWAQGRVRILCGLYGALRPLDAIRPYRLEMSTRVATARGPDLYSFWREYVTGHLSDALAALRADVRDDSVVLLDCASEEYSKVIDRKALPGFVRVVKCVFKDATAGGGGLRVVSVHAKRARGLMVRFVVQQRCGSVDEVKRFDLEGYRFAEEESDTGTLVFTRTTEARKAAEAAAKARVKGRGEGAMGTEAAVAGGAGAASSRKRRSASCRGETGDAEADVARERPPRKRRGRDVQSAVGIAAPVDLAAAAAAAAATDTVKVEAAPSSRSTRSEDSASVPLTPERLFKQRFGGGFGHSETLAVQEEHSAPSPVPSSGQKASVGSRGSRRSRSSRGSRSTRSSDGMRRGVPFGNAMGRGAAQDAAFVEWMLASFESKADEA